MGKAREEGKQRKRGAGRKVREEGGKQNGKAREKQWKSKGGRKAKGKARAKQVESKARRLSQEPRGRRGDQ
jgi:hypothetical protein